MKTSGFFLVVLSAVLLINILPHIKFLLLFWRPALGCWEVLRAQMRAIGCLPPEAVPSLWSSGQAVQRCVVAREKWVGNWEREKASVGYFHCKEQELINAEINGTGF